MRTRLAVAVALLCCTWPATAVEPGFKKPYFGATEAGTFARQKSTDETGAVTELTYSRLADVAGDRVIELRYAVVSGQFKGSNSITGCLVPASFPLENDAIDFQAHARRCVSATDAAPPTEYPPDIMKAIAEGMTNYAAIVNFKGTETVDGKPADRYGYEYTVTYMNTPATTTGDLWLSDTVPFGLVKDVMSIRDASGKTLTRIETVLVQTGQGAQTALPGWSWANAQPTSDGDSPLSSVLPAKDAFPACARGKETSPAQGLCDMKANPYISADRAFVTCMTEEILNKSTAAGGGAEVKPEQLSEALVSLHETDSSAIYVFGFAFKEAAPAAAAAKAWSKAIDEVTATIDERERASQPPPSVLTEGPLMVVVGCHVQKDPACCQEVTAAVTTSWRKARVR